MRKVISILLCLLFAFTMLFPIGALVSAFFGYTFQLTSVFAVSVISAVISVFTVISSIISKEKFINKVMVIMLYILAPISFINAIVYIFESGQISVAVCVLVSFLCISFLIIKNAMAKISKIVASVLCTLMTAFILFFAFIMLMFGNIGQNTVIKNIDSPSGNLYAQVIDSDQGALGGGTIVDVYEKRDIDVFVFKLRDKPQRVYVGEWGEFDNIKIHWKDDTCLVVNSVEYEIK